MDDLKDLEESYLLGDKLSKEYSSHSELVFYRIKCKKSKLKWVNPFWVFPFIIAILWRNLCNLKKKF